MKQVKLLVLLLALWGVANDLWAGDALMCQSTAEAQAGVVVVQFSGCLHDADFEEAMKAMLKSDPVKEWVFYYPEVAATGADRSVDDVVVTIFVRNRANAPFESFGAGNKGRLFYSSLAEAIANHLVTQRRVVKEVQLYIDSAAHSQHR